eukprot:CAMPEP_0175566082 /NCGR_PEP_ID=MMETSP0096-20121207/39771_1 /TAXON_ID=311494 /ORGANISM="Alexandrium monilatum, Strain CCMP3105" /LENGTH=265 /DNA_ID=CAMNT_0016869379 /DNA_START=27 /DNA_END=821 /DNA_ORIENTATION=-
MDAEVPEELTCSVCTGLFLEPQACPCGHVFCGYCIEHWLENRQCCPLCRAKASFSDLKESAEVGEKCRAFPIVCPWMCSWRGRRDELPDHVSSCPLGQFVDFTVQLDSPLGMCLEVLYETMLVGSLDGCGAASIYNQMTLDQEKQIRINDQVVAVDGVMGEAPLLAYLLHRPGRKNVTFRHPQELAVNITKGGKKLGLDLSWSRPNGIVTVLRVADGAVQEHNAYAGANQEQLLLHDRIIEVNGVDGIGDPERVVPALLQADTCV